MSKPRLRPDVRYIALIVKPLRGFVPKSWQDTPENYRVVEYVGPKQFRGRADAWRFMENKAVLDSTKNRGDHQISNSIDRWAIVIE